MLTVCLLNWRRPANVARIVSALHGVCKIFLWDNAGDYPADPRIDWQIRSSGNMRCHSRWWMAGQAVTPYVASLDDDLMPKDRHVLHDAVAVLQQHNEIAAVGPFGKVVQPGRHYVHWGTVANVESDRRADLLIGRCIIARTGAVAAARVTHQTNDDLQLCGALTGGRPMECLVPACMAGRFEELPAPAALCELPGHYSSRDTLAKEIWA